MKRIKYIILLVFICLSFTTCKDSFLDTSNPNQIDAKSFFKNYDEANMLANAMYRSLSDPFSFGGYYRIFPDVISGEITPVYNDNNWLQFMSFSITPSNQVLYEAWTRIYGCIKNANDLIENVATMTDDQISQQNRDVLNGQAYFMRAFWYLYLVKTYGHYYPNHDMTAFGVPMLTSVAKSKQDLQITRSTVGDIFNHVVMDFKKADELLPVSWTGNDLGRVTKGAAKAYLGITYIWFEKWDEAAKEFEPLFDLNRYSLMEVYAQNFDCKHENNKESIFELQYATSNVAPFAAGNCQLLSLLYGSGMLGAFANFILNPDAVEKMKPDPRFKAYAFSEGDTISNAPGVLKKFTGKNTLKKFIDPMRKIDVTLCDDHNITLLRLADIYLLYAEAQINLGNNALAAEYINKVRERAYGLTSDPKSHNVQSGAGNEELITQLKDERYKELNCELSLWFDMVRWGLAEQEYKSRGFIKGKHEAMPLPTVEIQLNPKIIQNEGY